MNRVEFINLSEYPITTKDGVIIQNKSFKKERRTISSNVNIFNFLGIPFYAKDIYGRYSVQAMCASKMYRDLGVETPIQYPFLRQIGNRNEQKLAMLSQDVRSVSDIFSEQILRIPEYSDLRSRLWFTGYYKNKWDYFLNENVKRWCLSFMTEECFNQVFDLVVLDEIRSEQDRGLDNLFLYKSPESGVYEGVVAIDLDLVHVLKFEHYNNKTSFNECVNAMSYFTCSPFGGLDDSLSYQERMMCLKSYYDSGRLPKRQRDLIDSCLTYDFPKLIRQSCKSSYLKKYSSRLYEPFSRLWEYDQKVFGV